MIIRRALTPFESDNNSLLGGWQQQHGAGQRRAFLLLIVKSKITWATQTSTAERHLWPMPRHPSPLDSYQPISGKKRSLGLAAPACTRLSSYTIMERLEWKSKRCAPLISAAATKGGSLSRSAAPNTHTYWVKLSRQMLIANWRGATPPSKRNLRNFGVYRRLPAVVAEGVLGSFFYYV